MSSTSTGPFTSLGSVSQVTITRNPDRVDTTSFGDSVKTSVMGFPDASIEFQGFYDLDDTVLKAARAVATGVMVGIYPNYPTDMAKFYAVLADVSFDYASGSTAAQTINGQAYARSSPIDNL
jgi:hypothetical protein